MNKLQHTSPESVGIRSSDIEKYIKHIESKNYITHDIIIMRHGKIVFEKYWEPFHHDFLHRMYSVTKSFVSLAIGFLQQDGMIDLDDKIAKYFPDEIKNQTDENMKNQTIRHMLMMSTAKSPRGWFTARTDDRVRFYFENDSEQTRPSGTTFEYDSTGSFIMAALVERLTGKTFIDYLREKLFNKIGVSKEAYCLKCPGGHSWGDSALICTAEDLLRTALFCMNKGKWNGEQILNEEYITAATSTQINNDQFVRNGANRFGYGYQFWSCRDSKTFCMIGMGDQLAVCVPEKDMILIYNGDNQGVEGSHTDIELSFLDMIANTASDEALPEDSAAAESLKAYTDALELFYVKGDKHSAMQDKINGVAFKMDKNPMGITKMKFCFEGNKGTMYYTNEQGDKEINFGMGCNEFGKFPQMGYSDIVGSQKGDRLYGCAASAAWVTDYQLFMKVQIIDTYFGILSINIGFRDNKIGVAMQKVAEDFLWEYEGFAGGTAE